jgi:O-antigen/teichoic acid export membrane protein
VIGAIITLVLNFALIPSMSYMGSAVATLAAYGSMMVISYVLGQRNYVVPYELKRIGGYLVLAMLFSALSFYVFGGNLIIGTALLLVFLSWIAIAEKKELKRIFKR